tara:strand:- start:5501 stop:6361 length:861 start_codon:yes stop_codon:yes gene_type:complete
LKEILKKLRKYEIQIRKYINNSYQGEYKSLFKGTGLDFDDTRLYNYGDDYRSINWKNSAKEDKIFINTYKEEKEQSVFFLIDVSNSQSIGNRSKLNISKEIASVLCLSAIRKNSQVGLLCYSDTKELFIQSKKGYSHAYRIIKELYGLINVSNKTNLDGMFKYFNSTIKKKSLVIILSDFLDKNFKNTLKSLSNSHDVICIHIEDKEERIIPDLGLIEVENNEENKKKWINTSSSEFNEIKKNTFKYKTNELQKFLKKINTNYLKVSTESDYVKDLIKLFKFRNTN